MEQLFVDLETLPQEIEVALSSTFGKPHTKEWSLPEGKLYAVIKLTHDRYARARVVLRWIGIFPPVGRKTGIVWRDFTMSDEAEARINLAEINDQAAAHFYEELLITHKSPIDY